MEPAAGMCTPSGRETANTRPGWGEATTGEGPGALRGGCGPPWACMTRRPPAWARTRPLHKQEVCSRRPPPLGQTPHFWWTFEMTAESACRQAGHQNHAGKRARKAPAEVLFPHHRSLVKPHEDIVIAEELPSAPLRRALMNEGSYRKTNPRSGSGCRPGPGPFCFAP